MRADKLVMAGVVGLGVFAAYKIAVAKPALPPPPNSQENEEGLILLGNPLSMQQGQYYRARLELPDPSSQPVPPFNSGGGVGDIEKALAALGFSEVRVYKDDRDLPRNWPYSTKKNVNSGTRWFQGRWELADIALPRPTQIQDIWILDRA